MSLLRWGSAVVLLLCAAAAAFGACSPLTGPGSSSDVCSPDNFCPNDTPPPQAAVDLCHKITQDPACGSLSVKYLQCIIDGRQCTLDGYVDTRHQDMICKTESAAATSCIQHDGGVADSGASGSCEAAGVAVCNATCACGTGAGCFFFISATGDAGVAAPPDSGLPPRVIINGYKSATECEADWNVQCTNHNAPLGISVSDCMAAVPTTPCTQDALVLPPACGHR